MNTTRSLNRTSTYATYGNLALKPSSRPQLTLVADEQDVMQAPARVNESHVRRSARTQHVARPQHKGELVRATLALFLFCTILAGATLFSDGLIAHRHATATKGVGTVAVCVHHGDSLWSLAERHGIDGLDTAEVVEWIKQTNGLENASISAGETILVASQLS